MAKSSACERSLTPPQVVLIPAAFLALSYVGGVLSADFAAPFAGATAALTRTSAELLEESPSDFNVQPSSQISALLASDSSEITKLYAENRIATPLSSTSVNIRDVIIAVEDQRFYQYQSVDPIDIVQVLVSSNADSPRQGASTLAQQYVRDTLIETGLKNDDHKLIRDAMESTVVYKLREMKFVPSLKQKYPKQQVLEGYLNIAAFNPSTYRAEASSLYYFNKHARDLMVTEAALPAGITNAPSAYDPESQPELAKNRRDWMLVKTLEEKLITKQQYDKAINSEVKLDIQGSPAGCRAMGSYAYFCTYVANEILGSGDSGSSVAARRQLLARDGLKITTTLDSERQSAAGSVIQARAPIEGSGGTSSTIVSIEPGTGRIQAPTQSTNYESSQLVFAADAKHGGAELPDGNVGFQSGSVFKVIILVEWLKTDRTPYQMLNVSASKNYGPNTFTVSYDPDHAAGSWPVNNVVGTNAGIMVVGEATKQSINTGFIEILRDLDVCEVMKLAASVDIAKADGSQLDPDSSIALGGTPVPPLSTANAYATSASGGKYCRPVAIGQILGAGSTSMAAPSADYTQAADQGAVDEIAKTPQATSKPRDAAKDAVFGRSIVGETGTTDETKNTWFMGFIPQLFTTVWIGDTTEGGRSLVGRAIGGVYFLRIYDNGLAVSMWRGYMSQVMASDPALPTPSHG